MRASMERPPSAGTAWLVSQRRPTPENRSAWGHVGAWLRDRMADLVLHPGALLDQMRPAHDQPAQHSCPIVGDPRLGEVRGTRDVIPDTNALGSVNARIRKAVKGAWAFPHRGAALNCLYLAVMSLDPTG